MAAIKEEGVDVEQIEALSCLLRQAQARVAHGDVDVGLHLEMKVKLCGSLAILTTTGSLSKNCHVQPSCL